MKTFDLSMPISEKTPVYPGDPLPKIVQSATIKENGWSEKRITFTTHFSTHIDAPFHMLEKGKKLDAFPLSTFFGSAIVLDLKKPDLKKVKKGDIVFLYSGHTEKMYHPDFFKNNPVISERLANDLIQKKIKIIGFDSYTVDNEPFPVHKVFMRQNILIVENVVNLKKLVNKRFTCYILPLPIKDADGAPCRVIGLN